MLYRDIWLEILPFINQNCLLLSIVYVPNVNKYIENFNYYLFSKHNIKHVISIIHLNHYFELKYICKQSNIKLVKLMIQKGANDWNWGLYHACQNDHMKIVQLMIQKDADDWNWALYGACEGGHINIVKLMIQKGANDWNRGLYNACDGGHMNIVQLMIQKGANNWNGGLFYACRSGQIADHSKNRVYMKIVQLMIQKGASECEYCNKSMEEHLNKNRINYN